MEYLAVAFRSRAHTMKFYEMLKSIGVGGQIINTPKEAGVGCGLSVRVSPQSLLTVRRAVRVASLPSFAGIFSVVQYLGRRTVKSI